LTKKFVGLVREELPDKAGDGPVDDDVRDVNSPWTQAASHGLRERAMCGLRGPFAA
jgi:hypothetical protein